MSWSKKFYQNTNEIIPAGNQQTEKNRKCFFFNSCFLGTPIGSKFGLIMVSGKSVDHGLDFLIMNLNRSKFCKYYDK